MAPERLRSASGRDGADDVRPPIRVVLADDHGFMRRSLRHVLDADADLSVVAEASDMTAVMRHIRVDRPDVLVLDAGIPAGPILSSIRELRSAVPDTAIVLTTMTADDRLAREAIAAGASGYVLKDSADADLIEAIRRAASGRSFVASAAARGSREQTPEG
jgi:DNA-binding NarL/FixJ family response regulator